MGSRTQSLSEQLRAEATEMEARLEQLRQAMAMEKAKRDSVRSKQRQGNTLWASAAPGPLKGKDVATLVRKTSRERRMPTATPPQATVQDLAAYVDRERGATSQVPTATEASSSTRGAAVRGGQSKLLMTMGTEDGRDASMWSMPELPEMRASGGKDAERPSKAGASAQWSGTAALFQPSTSGPTRAVAGTSSLLDGDFDEEASKAAFQAALLEWRSGGSGAATKADPGPATGPARVPTPPRHAPQAVIEIQTDAPPAAAAALRSVPSTRSYFERLECRDMSRAAADKAQGAASTSAVAVSEPQGPILPTAIEYPPEENGDATQEAGAVTRQDDDDDDLELEYEEDTLA